MLHLFGKRQLQTSSPTEQDPNKKPRLTKQDSKNDIRSTDQKRITYRLCGIDASFDRVSLRSALCTYFGIEDGLTVHSLAYDPCNRSNKVATVTFQTIPEKLKDTKSARIQHSGASKGCIVIFDTKFDDFTPVTDADLEDKTSIDCILIHGWGAHPIASFSSPDSDWFWPRDDLNRHFPEFRVLLYGYYSNLQDPSTITDVDDYANTFRQKLADVRKSAESKVASRPLIYIVHSLGGWVLMKAMVRMTTSKHSDDEINLDMTKGALLFGVPCEGMETKSLLNLIQQDDLPSVYTATLLDKAHGFRYRKNQTIDFYKCCSESNAIVYTFYETKKTPTVIRDEKTGFWVRNGPEELLVNPDSATSGCEDDRRHYEWNSRHNDMLKLSEGDRKYHSLLNRLREIVRGIESGQPRTTHLIKDDRRHAKLTHMVPSRNLEFTGREAKLKELEDRLLTNKCRQLAIYGLGGVGKTQLALEFCNTVKEKYPDRAIFWVSALSEARFKQDYIKLAKTCALPTDSSEDNLMSLVKDHLESEAAGKWLLVVDNADNKTILFNKSDGGIASRLPKSEAGIILFTTRYIGIASDLARANILKLEEMSLKEAQIFLNKFLLNNTSTDDEEAVNELLDRLQYLPLAIVQACSYIVKKSITIPKYLALMKDTEHRTIKLLNHEFQDDTRDIDAENAVALTWLVSFEQIEREEPEAAKILFFVALLENRSIPLSILPSESDSDLTDAIGTLLGYSFMSKQEDIKMYDMHRLVHLVTRYWMRKGNIFDDWRKKTVSHLAEIFPWDKWENRHLWQEYTPHAIRVLQVTKDIPSQERAELCIRLGRCLEKEGRIREAVTWISECVAWRQEWLPESDPGRLIAEHTLAKAYGSNGQAKKAVNILEKVVEIYASAGVFAEDYISRLGSQHDLAGAYLSNGQIKKAVSILEKVVEIRSRVLAEDHPDRLASQHALARVYESNGQIKEAVNILEKVVEIKTRVFAEDHPDRLVSQHALAGAYLSNGQIKKAVSILEKVVEIRTRELAEDHPDRLVSQHYLAFVYQAEKRLDEAIPLMQHVVAIQEKSLRIDHPDRLLSESRLSQMLNQKTSEDSPTTKEDV